MKKSICTISVISLIASIRLFGQVIQLPTEQELDHLLPTTNTADVLMLNAYPILTNIYYNSSLYPSSEVSRVRYHLMTNILGYTISTTVINESETRAHASLFGWIAKFPYMETDSDALLYCADYIATLSNAQISTNSLYAETKAAFEADVKLDPKYGERRTGIISGGWNSNWGPNRRQLEHRRRAILRSNRYLQELRKKVIANFKITLTKFQKVSGAEALETIKPQIIRRAKLTPDEVNELFPQTQQE